jgi:hypothetical protein
VVILFEAKDLGKVKAFAESADPREIMQEAGAGGRVSCQPEWDKIKV